MPVFSVGVSPCQSFVLKMKNTGKKPGVLRKNTTILLWDINYGRGILVGKVAGVFRMVECESDFIEILIAEILFCASCL